MNSIKEILDKTDNENFKSLDLKSLNLKEYKKELESRLNTISDNDYQIYYTEKIKFFVLAVIEQNFEKKQELERIHYDLLMKWVSIYQKETLYSIVSGKEIVTFFVSIISSEILNHYEENTQNSILKQLLLRYENISLFQILYDNGLKIESIESLNPYYYALLNGTSSNMLIQLLFKNNIPLPKGYWAYIFESIAEKKIKAEKDFLLYLNDKDFIINENTKESVWNIILKTKSYDLIKYLSDDCYKPYVLDGKSIIDQIIISENFEILNNIKEKIFKLVNKNEELYPLWETLIKKEKYTYLEYIPKDFFNKNKILLNQLINKNSIQLILELKESIFNTVEKEEELYVLWNNILNDENNSILFLNYFYGVFSKIIKKNDHKKYTILKNKIQYLENKINNNPINIILKEITKFQYENKEITDNFIDYLSYTTVDVLIKIYKGRKDFPDYIRREILLFLQSIGFVESYPKQSDDVMEKYRNIFNILINEYKKNKFKDSIKFNQHFEQFFKSLNNKELKIIFDIMEVIIEESNCSNYFDSSIIGDEKNSNIKKDNVDDLSNQLTLFSNDSIAKFYKNYSNSKNEIIKEFINNLTQHKNKSQIKTLAKASLLLENIEKLYETFPHFEKVIKHIENLMILQEKGDKSFYIPPLLLGGGPGVGKTFFCNTISKLIHTNFELLNMESMTSSFVLTGLSSSWSGADTGRIFKSLFNEENKNMNPIFLLDELEKAGGDSRYGVMNSLLPLLERYTAKKFKDECIPLEIDASYIVWFATANDLDKLTPPIKSRFDIFSVPNPNPTQRKSLIKGIYKVVRESNTWGSYFNELLPDDSLDVLANLMAPGAARDLRKSITMACSKAIREESSIILPHHIERYENGEVMPWDVTN